MYNLQDTIAAFSSPAAPDAVYHIIRISGPSAFEIINSLSPNPPKFAHARLTKTHLTIDHELSVDVTLYPFRSPNSYTGDDLIEIHLLAPICIADALLKNIFLASARPAQPGEFTARAYFAGKLDLAQAQAVAQLITATNSIQLRAAHLLLKGALQSKLDFLLTDLLDLISLIEASLDFSEEDIEFISPESLTSRLQSLESTLNALLTNSLPARRLLALPSVAIAGPSNAGKSSLFNTLLARPRAIVSDSLATTRDVLTEILKLDSTEIALFDSAGLAPQPATVIDRLADSAARDAIASADLVLYCVDASDPQICAPLALFNSINPRACIFLATKSDLPAAAANLPALNAAFSADFLPISSATGQNLSALKSKIASALAIAPETTAAQLITLTNTQNLALNAAADHLTQALEAAASDNRPVTSMLLHAIYRTLADITTPREFDEAILSRIFSRFCIGK